MKYVLFVFTVLWSVIVGWGSVALLFCLGVVKELRWEPTLVLTAVFRDWVIRPRDLPWGARDAAGNRILQPLFPYSITLGRGIVYWPDSRAPEGAPWTTVQHHEHVHVRQVEDASIWQFILGLIVMLIVGPVTGYWGLAVGLWLGIWFLGGLFMVGSWIAAAMRGRGPLHLEAEFERSAYAQTDPWGPQAESWSEWRFPR